jgi:hypothetical protein
MVVNKSMRWVPCQLGTARLTPVNDGVDVIYGANARVFKKKFGIGAKGRSSLFVVGRYLSGLVLRKPVRY